MIRGRLSSDSDVVRIKVISGNKSFASYYRLVSLKKFTCFWDNCGYNLQTFVHKDLQAPGLAHTGIVLKNEKKMYLIIYALFKHRSMYINKNRKNVHL